LARFAECLLPLIDVEPERAIGAVTEIVSGFAALFAECWLTGMRRKLGLSTAESEDRRLAEDFLQALHRNQADFTLAFRALCDAAQDPSAARICEYFADARAFNDWAQRWQARLAREPSRPSSRAESMRRVNPVFIPRNHRIEQMIAAAVEQGDFAPFEQLLAVLSKPYQEQAAFASYAVPPEPSERVLQTFCGT
jgi:uncharacterized protein YdiU (UPF0061 family)